MLRSTVSIRGIEPRLHVIHGTMLHETYVFDLTALKIVANRPMTAFRETMRSHDLHAAQRAALSPAARAVYERLVSGTYEIDLERLADALLARFETASAGCARPAASPGGETRNPPDPAPDTPKDPPEDPDASLSSAR
jgi:hypothetical protein